MGKFAICYIHNNEKYIFLTFDGQYHIYSSEQQALDKIPLIKKSLQRHIDGCPKIVRTLFSQVQIKTTFPTEEKIRFYQECINTLHLAKIKIKNAEILDG